MNLYTTGMSFNRCFCFIIGLELSDDDLNAAIVFTRLAVLTFITKIENVVYGNVIFHHILPQCLLQLLGISNNVSYS